MKARTMPGSIGALIAPVSPDVDKVMVDGPAGIRTISHPNFMPEWLSSNKILTWPNGSTALGFGAERPSRLRGPQFHWTWSDEIAQWRYEESWHNMQFGLRLPWEDMQPQCCATTTPRPIPLLRDLLKRQSTAVVKGTTYENRANLADEFFTELLSTYEGTRRGDQELRAIMLDDTPGALWNRALFDWSGFRVLEPPSLRKIVIAVDPATTTKKKSNETGIMVQGVFGHGKDSTGYVLEDLTGKYTPSEWGEIVVKAYRTYAANKVIAEVNQGGDMVVSNIKSLDPGVYVESVHAWRGKQASHEPIAGLYEKHRIRHVGQFAELEDQMATWSPESGEESPDRVDALSLGFEDLMLGAAAGVTPLVGRLVHQRRSSRE
jgi:phage terminase large subunit-like protein